MRHSGLVAFSILTGLVIHAGSPATPVAPAQTPLPSYFKTGILDFESRVWAQTQIERVYYNHRIWPKENPGPKPAFEEAVRPQLIRSRIVDLLKMRSFLVQRGQTTIAADRLQMEVERIHSTTRSPAILSELKSVLRNDPGLFANTIALDVLVSREIHNRFQADDSVNMPARASAENLQIRISRGENVPGEEITYVERNLAGKAGMHQTSDPRVIELPEEPFRILRQQLRTSTNSMVTRENAEHVIVLKMRHAVNSHEFQATFWQFAKPAFEDWLSRQEIAAGSPAGEPEFRYPFHWPDTVTPALGCGAWDLRIDRAPEKRRYHTAVWSGSEMIVWGGSGPDGWPLRTGGRYDPATDTWRFTNAGDASPEARFSHTAVWTGSRMIVWGGKNSEEVNSGGQYDPGADRWTPTTYAGVPQARYDHQVVWTGSEMIIWGGQAYLASLVSGARYRPDTDSWIDTNAADANVPSPRYHPSAVWTGSEMIVWGGSTLNATYNQGSAYSPATDSWRALSAPAGFLGRENHSAIWTGTYMILWSGVNYNYTSNNTHILQDGIKYNPVTNMWIPINTSNGPVGRQLQTTIWTGTEMIIWGGGDDAGGFYLSGSRYNPATDTWQRTATTAGVPAPRTNHTAVWTGSEMIVWGGYFGSVFNDGGRYRPATDDWIPVVPGNGVPAARYNHSGVWTGSEYIVWGGYGDTSYLSSGASYNLALNAWKPISAAQAPSPRYNHSAVWTGTRMVIWGGSNVFYQNSGGRYDPASDSWTPTSLSGAPSERGRQSTVWTGQEMIIWGGLGNSSNLGGGRYNPSADTWTGMSNPYGSQSYGHTAVWTGSQMIIYGSLSGSPGTSGFSYDTQNDQWQALPGGAGSPGSRANHSAVWTGAEMIIWGGNDSNFTFQTGARYNPATGIWNALPVDGDTPSARQLHVASWTGSDMLIWGGLTQTPFGYPRPGGSFNLSNNQWHPILDQGDGPTGRYDFTGAWTGNELLIWGGAPSGGSLDSGGLYNPAGVVITKQPMSVAVCSGQNAVFSVKAGGHGINFQWRLNGQPLTDGSRITGTGTDTLGITNVTNADSGSYELSLADSCGGQNTSSPATLTVLNNQPPAFSGLSGVTASPAGTCSLSLSWQAATSQCGLPLAYSVYRSASPSFTPSAANRIVGKLTGNSYVDNNSLSPGQNYYYIVRANDSSGNEEQNVIIKSGAANGNPIIGAASETFEGAQSGGGFDNAGWAHASGSGAMNWAWSSAQAKSPTHSWYSQSLASASDRTLTSPLYTMTATASLTFWHTYYFDYNVSLDVCKDGGTLEFSGNGGASWVEVPLSAYTAGGYNGVIGPAANPLHGKDAWCGGAIGPMTQVSVNLSAYNGQTIQIRWHAGDDGAVARTGWYVDSVMFNNVQVSSACTTCNGTAMSPVRGLKSGADLQVNWTGVAGISAFNIYRSAVGPNPYTWGAPAGSAGGGAIAWLDTGQLTSTASQFYTVTDTNTCGAESPR